MTASAASIEAAVSAQHFGTKLKQSETSVGGYRLILVKAGTNCFSAIFPCAVPC